MEIGFKTCERSLAYFVPLRVRQLPGTDSLKSDVWHAPCSY
jgi:hypothetical protein